MAVIERWSLEERERIADVRRRLGSKITSRAQYPDVVGDRRILRFLRGVPDINVACDKYSKFLDWRDANDVDTIRNNILYGGMNDPHFFPRGEEVLRFFPQIVCAADACDNAGNPLSVERYNFSPSEALKVIPTEDYIKFQIYTMEYKILVMEQLSNSKEKAKLAHLQRELKHQQKVDGATSPTYGVVLRSFYFRDFEGFSLEHLGSDGQKLLGSVLEFATANYPELLHKSHMINVPWVFNIVWVFVKPFLDQATIDKVNIHGWGADYISAVKNEISIESIPAFLGGKFEGGNSAFSFDISPDGPYGPPPVSFAGGTSATAAAGGATAATTAATTTTATTTTTTTTTIPSSQFPLVPESSIVPQSDSAPDPVPEPVPVPHENLIEAPEPPVVVEDTTTKHSVKQSSAGQRKTLNEHDPSLFGRRLLRNPYAWLLYLRIVVLAPLASTGSQVVKRLSAPSTAPLLNSLAFASLTISGCAVLGHWVSLGERKGH